MELFIGALLILSTLLSLHSYLGASQIQDIDGFLSPHNAARAAVGVANLTWSPAVATFVQNYTAVQRSQNACRSMIHSGGPYGENMFWGSAGKAWNPTEAVDSWVSAKQFYNYATNSCAVGQQCGQYTQVVWRATTTLACNSVVCNDNSTLIMCGYAPPGNIVGQKPF